MKIEIRKLTVNHKFSQETLMFMADVYVDGKKVAYARNEGHGGCTNIQPYEGQRELLRKAEEYCKSLPMKYSKAKGDNFDMEQNLESIIDDLVYAEDNAKEKERFEKKMQKHMLTSIIYGVPDSGSYRMIGYKKTLAEVNASPGGNLSIQQLVNDTKKKLQPGEVILNTNLQALGINV